MKIWKISLIYVYLFNNNTIVMKAAFKIISITFILALVSCEKDVIVPNNEGSQVITKRSVHGSSVESSDDYSGDTEITDPNDRNWKISNGVDVSNRGAIIDPTDSGNSISKKTKR
jgi:hypothetical protein